MRGPKNPKIPDPDFISFSFQARLWRYQPKNKDDKGSWMFVTVPKGIAKKVAQHTAKKPRRGFGAVRVLVTVGHTRWGTSMFPDTKAGSYILPVKASVRKDENIHEGDSLDMKIELVGVRRP